MFDLLNSARHLIVCIMVAYGGNLFQLGSPVSVSLKLFDAMLIPILCYGCEICGFSEKKSDLEVVEMSLLKYVLHLPLNASNIAVHGEVGQLPLHLLWKKRILKYWHRLCSEDIPVLLKQAMVQA